MSFKTVYRWTCDFCAGTIENDQAGFPKDSGWVKRQEYVGKPVNTNRYAPDYYYFAPLWGGNGELYHVCNRCKSDPAVQSRFNKPRPPAPTPKYKTFWRIRLGNDYGPYVRSFDPVTYDSIILSNNPDMGWKSDDQGKVETHAEEIAHRLSVSLWHCEPVQVQE